MTHDVIMKCNVCMHQQLDAGDLDPVCSLCGFCYRMYFSLEGQEIVAGLTAMWKATTGELSRSVSHIVTRGPGQSYGASIGCLMTIFSFFYIILTLGNFAMLTFLWVLAIMAEFYIYLWFCLIVVFFVCLVFQGPLKWTI